MTDSLFLWDNPTPPEWQAALRAVSPAGERLSSFELVWEPGEPQDPIQRWVIWQMRPVSYTAMQIRRRVDPRFLGLTERHPREGRKWDASLGAYRAKDGSMAKTDRLTWELYQRTGQFGQRWWVVQGPFGGHRYHLTTTEKKILGVGRGVKEMDVPKPGDLPYAPFDQRVIRHLAAMEQVARWHKVCAYADANEARLDAEEQAEAEMARAKVSDWLDGQFGALFHENLGVFKQAFREMPDRGPLMERKDRKRAGDLAEQRETFIKEGT